MRFLSLSFPAISISTGTSARARLYHLHTYYTFLSRKPFARAIGSLGSGLRGTGFRDVQKRSC